jgi:hypothetical protein
MKRMLTITLIIFGFVILGIVESHAEILDFEDMKSDTVPVLAVANYTSQGFLLKDNLNDPYLAFPQEGNDYYLRSVSLLINYYSAWVTLSKQTGGVFSLDAVDLRAFDYPAPVEFFGYDSGGTQIAYQQFTLNDIDAWHTFNFNSNFKNIASVQWHQGSEYLQAADNIKLNSVVPEPISCVLFGVGGLTLAAARRFRKKQGRSS